MLHSYRPMGENTLYCILIGQCRKVPYIALFLSDFRGKYLILQSYRRSYRTLRESTLYCIITGQLRKVPYIA